MGLEAAGVLAAASVRLALARRSRIVAVLGAASEADAASSPTARQQTSSEAHLRIASAKRVGRMVSRVARLLPWRPTCLRQSLATKWLLKRRSIASVIHLGIADVTSMDAHAWVTVEGRVVNGMNDRNFIPVASFR